MSENVDGISGTVAPSPKVGTVCEGEIITIVKGRADEFMSEEQYTARKVSPDTPFIEIEIGITDYGTILKQTFADYSGANGTDMISSNTMHGRIIRTYEVLTVGETINMVAGKKDMRDGSTINVWSIVLA